MTQNKLKAHIVVDMLYDFIEGSMASNNSFNALEKSIQFINKYPEHKVLYVTDSHPSNHCSFREEGGQWPSHCVAGTKGQKIHEDFTTKITNPQNRPTQSNILKKGEDPDHEQYSGIKGKTQRGETLKGLLNELGISEIYVSGIATEYCIKETVKDLKKAGFKVNLIAEALAYVDKDGHKQTIEELKKEINII